MSKDIHITLELLNYEREAGRINDKKMFRAIGASFVSMFFIQWVILFVIAVAGSGYLWWLFLQGKKSSRLGPMAEKSKLAKARAEDLQRAAAGFMKVYEKSAQHVEFLENSIHGCELGWGWLVSESHNFALYSNYILTVTAPTGDIYKAKAVFADNTYVQHVPVTSESQTNFEYQINPSNNRHEVESAQTRFDTSIHTVRGGLASVSIEGPKLVPGVILFEDSESAAEFANDFNQQVSMYAQSKSEISTNLADLKKLLKEAKVTAKSVPIDEMEGFFNSVDRNCGYLVFGEYYEPLAELFDPNKRKLK